MNIVRNFEIAGCHSNFRQKIVSTAFKIFFSGQNKVNFSICC